MTAPTITTEDFMFDLDLQVVPAEKRSLQPSRSYWSDDCISGFPPSNACSYTCYTYTLCRRCNQ